MTADPFELDTPFGPVPMELDENGLVTAQSFQALSLKMLNADRDAWDQVASQLFGSDSGADSPLAIVMRVRAALVAGRVDSVRDLLSDRLYNRWRAAPPKPPTSFSKNLAITMSESSDDDGVATVTVGAGMTITNAPAEAWRFIRGSVAVPPAAGPEPVAQAGNCPTCGAPYEAGETACRYCGAALATPHPDPPPQGGRENAEVEEFEPQAGTQATGWIVDDVAPASSMAA